MRFEWAEKMNKEEEAAMKEFIQYVYDGFIKWGDDDRFVDHVLYIIVRDITRIIGERKNLKISLNAKKILGECKSLKDIEKAKRIYPNEIIEDHYLPAKEFFDEFRKKKTANKPFANEDADRWLNEATIAFITKDEDRSLTNHGFMQDRPLDAYEHVGIKLENI